MHRWGYPTRLDLLRSMACAIVEDRKRRNLECASDFFDRMLDPLTEVIRQDWHGNLLGPNLDLIAKNWYKRFLSRHPALSAIYSRSLDNSRALDNDPKIIREYFIEASDSGVQDQAL
jgi:malonyl CoA-acyl carrier protein transacylase